MTDTYKRQIVSGKMTPHIRIIPIDMSKCSMWEQNWIMLHDNVRNAFMDAIKMAAGPKEKGRSDMDTGVDGNT